MHDGSDRPPALGAMGADNLVGRGRDAGLPDPSPRIAIASPYDVWCAGMDAIVRRRGWVPAGRWPSNEDALAAGGLAGADVLVLAKRLVERPAGVGSFRPHEGIYAGKVVVVIEPADAFSADDFVALDVEGLILGTASLSEVNACFDSVLHGRRWVDPGIRALLGQAQRPTFSLQELSSRELEVARLAASGLSNKRIARALKLSDGTVKMHMHHILAKLRLTSRFDLVRSELFIQEPGEAPRRSPGVAIRGEEYA